jgi:hypothetical protein
MRKRQYLFSLTLNKADISEFVKEAQNIDEITLTDDDNIEYNGKNSVILKEVILDSEDFRCLIKDNNDKNIEAFIKKWRIW